MKDAPAFDFYPERWLVGTAMLSDAEQLGYLRLLCHQWMMDGLPVDLATLKRLAGKGVTPRLLEKFPIVDGKRRNARLEIVRAEQRQRIAQRRGGAEKTNRKRWGERVASDNGATSLATRSRHHGDIASESPPPTTHHPPQVLLAKEPKGGGVTRQPSARGKSASERQAERDAAEANAVTIPLGLATMPGVTAFREVWIEWCEYRTNKATTGLKSKRIDWTACAARNGLAEVERVAAGIGLPHVTARIREAMAGSWQGLNLTSMRTPGASTNPAPNHQPPRDQQPI